MNNAVKPEDKKPNLFNKENLKTVIVLVAICLIVAALMGAINLITAPEIENAEKKRISDSLSSALPNGEFGDSEAIPKEAPETVTGIYKDQKGGGHAVTLVTKKGYTGNKLGITVGIKPDGTINGVVITEYGDSLGKKQMEKAVSNFADTPANDAQNVELVTGVTYSSNAVRSAVNDALTVLGYVKRGYTDEELTELALKLMPEAEGFTEIFSPTAADTVKKIYRENSGLGFVVYTSTSTEHAPVETEGLVAIGADGRIVGVDLLTWTVGHGVEPHDGYEKGFVGKSAETIDTAELVTEATGTSLHFRDSIKDALYAVSGKEPAPAVRVYTIIGISAVALAVIAAAAVVIYKRRKRAA